MTSEPDSALHVDADRPSRREQILRAAARGGDPQLLGQVGDEGRVHGRVTGGRAGVGGRRAGEHRGIHGPESTMIRALM